MTNAMASALEDITVASTVAGSVVRTSFSAMTSGVTSSG